MTTKKSTKPQEPADREPDAKVLPVEDDREKAQESPQDGSSTGTLTATGEVLEYNPDRGEKAAHEGPSQASDPASDEK